MPKLIATRPILYLDKAYKNGEELPTDNPAMLQGWLDAGSAKWLADPKEKKRAPVKKDKVPEENKENTVVVTSAKATPETAEPGMPGEASTGEADALIGKVPSKGSRRKK